VYNLNISSPEDEHVSHINYFLSVFGISNIKYVSTLRHTCAIFVPFCWVFILEKYTLYRIFFFLLLFFHSYFFILSIFYLIICHHAVYLFS
jgi:hypothetical protein